ncbi:hypothetical protein PORY_002708 [Pneumocystis oryctolagi]|uniref:Uncharacterized protein n=1 Tax=Pneumocystis oryctolagi TaxID=42067 RepID=A0ACB7C8P3_9ASCO|nr:hypothetical protein PORY_002708 [Pneumocystis oryctolagi]
MTGVSCVLLQLDLFSKSSDEGSETSQRLFLPIKIIERETRGHFGTFLTSTVIIISGVLTIASIIDHYLFEKNEYEKPNLKSLMLVLICHLENPIFF